MKFCVATVLALSCVVPTYSFSYLDQLGGASPTIASNTVNIAHPVPVAAATVPDPPFFFTNGASDVVTADSPAFFFTSGSTDLPAETTATSAGSYLDVLGNGATSASGPGMANYLDALPQNNASGGPGISSYASSLNQAASEVYMAAAPAAPPVAAPAAAEVSHSIPDLTAAATAAPNAGSYLDALATGSSSSGAGITTYLETLPQTCILSGGAGMSTYASNLVSANVVSGAGVPTYTDVLGGGLSSYTNSFSPFGAASISSSSGSSQSNFAIGSVTGRFDFTLEADAAMIAQLQAAGDRRVTIKGQMRLQ
ncbi:MAG: hypothetical protein ACI90V_008313 [Bacillariaceae sp.]|jgi:hypothetical protein